MGSDAPEATFPDAIASTGISVFFGVLVVFGDLFVNVISVH
jgi:hypothetical protein